MGTTHTRHNDNALPPPSRDRYYRLSAVQRKVLSTIQHNGKLSIPQITKLIQSKENNVRYAISTLRENGIIYSSPLIDLTRLGFHYHSLAFSVSSQDSEVMNKIRDFLRKTPQIVSSCETGGNYQFAVVFAARSPHGIDVFFRALEEVIGDNVREKKIATHLKLSDYRSDYLYQKQYGIRSITWGATDSNTSVDELDHLILASLASSQFTSLAQVSRKYNVALSTIEYRLKRLESEKIILGYRNLIRSDKLGAHRFWMTISAKGSSSTLERRFFDYCEGNPFARFASRTIGSWDFELSFDALDAASSTLIVQNFNDEFDKRVAATNLIPVFQYTRVNTYPFTQEPHTYA